MGVGNYKYVVNFDPYVTNHVKSSMRSRRYLPVIHVWLVKIWPVFTEHSVLWSIVTTCLSCIVSEILNIK